MNILNSTFSFWHNRGQCPDICIVQDGQNQNSHVYTRLPGTFVGKAAEEKIKIFIEKFEKKFGGTFSNLTITSCDAEASHIIEYIHTFRLNQMPGYAYIKENIPQDDHLRAVLQYYEGSISLYEI